MAGMLRFRRTFKTAELGLLGTWDCWAGMAIKCIRPAQAAASWMPWPRTPVGSALSTGLSSCEARP